MFAFANAHKNAEVLRDKRKFDVANIVVLQWKV
jgi:hypothetical protein